MPYLVLHVVPPQVSLSHEILKLLRHEKNATVDCYGSGKPRPAVTWKRGRNDVPVLAEITANETNQVLQTRCFLSFSRNCYSDCSRQLLVLSPLALCGLLHSTVCFVIITISSPKIGECFG